MTDKYSYSDHPLKHCPFCGSVAKRTGGTVGDITIKVCRCSNDNCICSFKSVSFDEWNNRVPARDSNKTTKAIWSWGKCYD